MAALSTAALKVILLVTMLIITFVLSMIPILLSRYTQHTTPARARRIRTCLGLLSCFAGGVFLATCLLDLFPDAQEQMEAALSEKDIDMSYPMTECLVVVGFLIVFLIEQVVMTREQQPERGGEREGLLNQERREGGDRGYGGIDNRGIVESAEDEHQGHHHHHDDHVVDFAAGSSIRAILLLLALTVHSILEGLAIGLQPTAAKVLSIFVAVSLHKGIVAFALGLNLVQCDLSLKMATLSNAIFSVASPLGIGIGILFLKVAPASPTTDLVNAVLQAFACGTFLFVVFFEILPHEFMGGRYIPRRMLKACLLVVGFSMVAALMCLEPDEDNSGDVTTTMSASTTMTTTVPPTTMTTTAPTTTEPTTMSLATTEGLYT